MAKPQIILSLVEMRGLARLIRRSLSSPKSLQLSQQPKTFCFISCRTYFLSPSTTSFLGRHIFPYIFFSFRFYPMGSSLKLVFHFMGSLKGNIREACLYKHSLTLNPASLMFYLDKLVIEFGSANFPNPRSAMNSPLAKAFYGIDVTTFCNETEALSAFSSNPESFHVAIVEVNTSKGNWGFQFLDTAKDMPIIMTSNIHCLNTMMKCISKPLCEEKLRNIWQHVVHKVCYGMRSLSLIVSRTMSWSFPYRCPSSLQLNMLAI